MAVVGKKDNILSESIVAFIVPKPGEELKRGEVIKYCRQVLSSNKIPDDIYFVKELPTILNGKVQKNVLTKWAETQVPEEILYKH